MKKRHESKNASPARVAEPVQVYLVAADRARLERLTAALVLTKSDVLRRGLLVLEGQALRAGTARVARVPLPTFAGQGLLPGVDLTDTASLLELMEARDAVR